MKLTGMVTRVLGDGLTIKVDVDELGPMWARLAGQPIPALQEKILNRRVYANPLTLYGLVTLFMDEDFTDMVNIPILDTVSVVVEVIVNEVIAIEILDVGILTAVVETAVAEV